MKEIKDIQGEISRLEEKRFMIQMNDHMSGADFIEDRKLFNQIQELKKQLEAINGNSEV